jgi:hypothetical protein
MAIAGNSITNKNAGRFGREKFGKKQRMEISRH